MQYAAYRYYYYVLLAPISRGTLPCAMHGHAPWLLADSLHSSPSFLSCVAGIAFSLLQLEASSS